MTVEQLIVLLESVNDKQKEVVVYADEPGYMSIDVLSLQLNNVVLGSDYE